MEKPVLTSESCWYFSKAGRCIEFSIKNGVFQFYDGPEEPTARSHEGGGGQIPLNNFPSDHYINRDYPEVILWLRDNCHIQ